MPVLARWDMRGRKTHADYRPIKCWIPPHVSRLKSSTPREPNLIYSPTSGNAYTILAPLAQSISLSPPCPQNAFSHDNAGNAAELAIAIGAARDVDTASLDAGGLFDG